MTSSDRDLSDFGGQPVTLYEFVRLSVPTISGIPVQTFWRYTSLDRDYVYPGNGQTYTAIAISDDGVRQTSDTQNDSLTVTMPATAAIPQMFLIAPPSDTISAAVIETHFGEDDAFISWTGAVGSVNRTDDIGASVVCVPAGASLDRAGLRLCYTRACPHNLYGPECRADPTLHYVEDNITTLNAAALEAPAFATLADGDFLGGYIEWLDTYGHAERRGIIGHSGVLLTIMGVLNGLAVGDSVWAFRGCNHSPDAVNGCQAFDNLVNYGGDEYLPGISPFSGQTIF